MSAPRDKARRRMLKLLGSSATVALTAGLYGCDMAPPPTVAVSPPDSGGDSDVMAVAVWEGELLVVELSWGRPITVSEETPDVLDGTLEDLTLGPDFLTLVLRPDEGAQSVVVRMVVNDAATRIQVDTDTLEVAVEQS